MSYKKKIVMIGLFCLGTYILLNLILLLFPLQKKYIYKDKERGEEYIYSGKRYPVVFAGSGLIGHFSNENLGRKNFYNLFFPYGGGCTGIELLSLSGKIPDTLFVEINYLFKGFNDELIGKLFDRLAYRLKFYLPCLQEKNKLLPLAKEMLIGSNPPENNSTSLPDSLFKRSIDTLKTAYQQEIDTTEFTNIIARLKKHVNYISSRNCTVIFFEMPVDKDLSELPTTRWKRAVLKETFSDKKVIWQKPDSIKIYSTSDGIHLLDESLKKYLDYFNSALAVK